MVQAPSPPVLPITRKGEVVFLRGFYTMSFNFSLAKAAKAGAVAATLNLLAMPPVAEGGVTLVSFVDGYSPSVHPVATVMRKDSPLPAHSGEISEEIPAASPEVTTPNWNNPFVLNLCGEDRQLDLSMYKEKGRALACLNAPVNETFMQSARTITKELSEMAKENRSFLSDIPFRGLRISPRVVWLGTGCTVYAIKSEEGLFDRTLAQAALYSKSFSADVENFLETVATFGALRSNPPSGDMELLVCQHPRPSASASPSVVAPPPREPVLR